VPAYVIFHDATLREIAATRPSSLAELGTVSGVGEAKLAKYGQQVLSVLGPAPGEPSGPAGPAGPDEPGLPGAADPAG
jgi:ATP-dependent DNA helicase RecQ